MNVAKLVSLALHLLKSRSVNRWRLVSYVADLVVIFAVLVFSLVSRLLPSPTLYFRIDDPEISYPHIEPIVTIRTATFVLIFVPPALLSLYQALFVRDVHDYHHSMLGFLHSLVLSIFFCSVFWWGIGGFRPQFLHFCDPDPHVVASELDQNPHRVTYFNDSICRGSAWNILEMKKGFPSGHAANSLSGFLFLSFYLNAKLKPFKDGSVVSLWQPIVVVAPAAFAIWLGLSRTIDYYHSPSTVWVGLAIGTLSALLGYRMHFCSLFNSENNHRPRAYGILHHPKVQAESAIVEMHCIEEREVEEEATAEELNEADEMK